MSLIFFNSFFMTLYPALKLKLAPLFFYSIGVIFHALAFFLTLLCLIIVIAFFTVLERKLLASIQRRSGPNMSSLWGLLQAFADAIKLLLKEPLVVSGANFYIFVYAPVVLLTLSLTL
eukprot:TRINITY_DN1103_c0_g1_i19.p2 TRINITY_DN1103_c0_g1~~TRINITY_DN1103_c0_g1_i19.p2  ORF type:complete len:118 (+),score=5.09 TRINITY_DN1103_c0_g1_i19:686-1039(+)